MAVSKLSNPPKTDTLGVLYGEEDIRDLVRKKYPELYYIVKCESNFRPNVCSFAGCQAGMGLIQVIPSSLRLCEKALGKKLNPYNVEDNLECGEVLLRIQGLNAWESSRECWEKYKN